MDNQSLTSLILLIVFFFVVPSLLKYLGRNTKSSKGEQEREEEPGEILPPRETMPGHPETYHQDSGMHDAEHTVISNEPIHPKWF